MKKMLKEIEDEKIAEQKAKEEAGKKEVVTEDILKLADKMAEKIAKSIVEAKGGNSVDQKQLKEHLFNPRNGFQAIEYPEDLTNLSADDKISVFFKSFLNYKTDEKSNKVFKALVEGTSADGGYLVPKELATEVWRILPDISVMRQIARVIPMSTRTLDLNSLTARPVAYWIGEYNTKTTTSAEFGQVTLTANKLVCLLPVTHELLQDANISLANLVIQLFAEALGVAEDKAFFSGSGTSQPKGINQETLTSVAAGGAVTMDHIIDLIDSVPARVSASPRTSFVGHRYVKRILRKLKDTTNQYIWRDGGFANNGQTTKLPDTLYGYPFHEQNDLSSHELYFGDWSFYLIGDRQMITVDSTNEGGDAWRQDATEYKAVERVDGAAVLTTPFAKITGI